MPQTMASFGWKDFLSNFDHEVLFHFHRMTKSMFIGSTSFLSVFQVIAISPRDSRWAELKGKSTKINWVFLVSELDAEHCLPVFLLLYMWEKNTSRTTQQTPKILDTLLLIPNAKISIMLYAALLSFPDFLSVEIIVWASTSMVLILHRYKHRMQHMRRTNVPSTSSTECRVNKTILLGSTLVCFSHSLAYWLSL